METQAEHPDQDYRFLNADANADARTPCSGTLGAKRPESFSSGPIRNDQHRPHGLFQDHSASLTRSLTTSSSHRLTRRPSSLSSHSPVFNTALYDPSSDSIHIMPNTHQHTRQTSLESQFREFKDRVNNTKPQHSDFPEPKRPHSLNILRNACEIRQGSDNSSLRLSSAANGKTFE